MNISEKLTQKELQEILLNTYKMGHETENLKVIELIEAIQQQVILAIKK